MIYKFYNSFEKIPDKEYLERYKELYDLPIEEFRDSCVDIAEKLIALVFNQGFTTENVIQIFEQVVDSIKRSIHIYEVFQEERSHEQTH